MKKSVGRYLPPAWTALLLFAFACALPAAARQPAAAGARGAQAKLEVEAKARYFLGETPAVRIRLTNAGRAPQSVREAEYQKFSLEATGLFNNADTQETKSAVYDGSWDIPKEPPQTLPGQPREWLEPKKREPKFVTLAPGEATTLELNLSRTFRSYLGVSKYRLVVKAEDGQQAVKDFEVYFDDEQSFPILAKMLVSDDEAERNTALSNLVTFSRPRLAALLEEWVKSGDAKQRELAREVLTKLAAGHFDPLRLRVEMKERFFLGEAPTLAISVVNGSSIPQSVTAAENQRFTVEVLKEAAAAAKPATMTCVYEGGREKGKRPASVTLGELEATTLSLNLFVCLNARLDVGRYELTVKSADGQQPFKDQRVVRKFEVYSRPAPPREE